MSAVSKAILLLLLCVCAHAERVICIGDSITQGGARPQDYSYRLPLQTLLKADFIGTQHTGLDPSVRWPDGFDPDHEGYYGATTAQVRQRLQQSLPKLPPPDIALVYLGTNDRLGETVGPLEDIIGQLRAKNPKVRVYVGLLAIDGWRGLITRMLVRRMTARLHVVAVPPAFGKADTFDGVHPNPCGQAKMARAWYAAING
jgi:lysophospholipase L1-like esterase